MKDGVIQTLDFTDFGTCLGCIKGQQTNKSNKGAKRSDKKLKIIHTDICGPFTPNVSMVKGILLPSLMILQDTCISTF